MIKDITIYCEKHELLKPYILSFDTIQALDSIRVEITLHDGDKRVAETVPLPGYSDETKESILLYLNRAIPGLAGKDLADARNIVEKDISKNPFACSPLLTAMDLFEFECKKFNPADIEFVVPLASSNIEEMGQAIKNVSNFSSKTLKIKLSGNTETDIKCIEFLEMKDLNNFRIRFDANQAYSYKDACLFYSSVKMCKFREQVSYVEQPLGIDCWDEHEKLVKEFPDVKTMLDESVVKDSDLYRAIALRIPFVKFKLFKQGGIKELIRQIHHAFEKGIHVVLGNGVATKLSNDIENAIYLLLKEKIYGASEANGFLKLKDNK